MFKHFFPDIGIMVRVIANGPGDLGSITSWVIPKTQKWYLTPLCLTLSIIRYRSRVNRSNLGKWLWSPTLLTFTYFSPKNKFQTSILPIDGTSLWIRVDLRLTIMKQWLHTSQNSRIGVSPLDSYPRNPFTVL